MSRRRSLPSAVAVLGELEVVQDPERPSGRLLRQAGMDASYVDLADPGHLEFDYLRWIRVVLRVAGARRVLHLGGGAAALARALAAADPDGRQEVHEVDPDVLAVARAHMGLTRAAGLRVRQGDGRAALAGAADGAWDAVVIDAFVGAVVPRSLISAEALREAARVAPRLALVNVVDDRRARDVATIAAGMGEAYAQVWGIGGRDGNTVVVGEGAARSREGEDSVHGAVDRARVGTDSVHGAVDRARVAAQLAADPSPARLLEPAAMARLAAGAVPAADPEAPG